MHLVLQNVAPTLFKLWNRTKLAIDKPSNPNFETSTYLGHALRRINNHYNGYKAAEWEAWLKLFGVPLLDQRLDEQCVENFRDLSRIYTLATQHSLKQTDIKILDTVVVKFVQSYERIYLYTGTVVYPIHKSCRCVRLTCTIFFTYRHILEIADRRDTGGNSLWNASVGEWEDTGWHSRSQIAKTR
jgi:hypothetical protein